MVNPMVMVMVIMASDQCTAVTRDLQLDLMLVNVKVMVILMVISMAISMVIMTTANKQVMVMGGLGEEHSVMKLVLGQNNWYLFLFLQIYSHLLARAGTCTGTCTCTWTCTCTCTGTCLFLQIYSHSKYIHL